MDLRMFEVAYDSGNASLRAMQPFIISVLKLNYSSQAASKDIDSQLSTHYSVSCMQRSITLLKLYDRELLCYE